jgi:hypothetical protein
MSDRPSCHARDKQAKNLGNLPSRALDRPGSSSTCWSDRPARDDGQMY